MITVEQYLEAKKIVEQYEEELKTPLLIWRCNKNLKMENTKQLVFTKGNAYKQIDRNKLSAIDDCGSKHEFGKWGKYFTTI